MSADREAFARALHAAIDGDFLIDAGGPGKDMPISQCGAADVVRWASNVFEAVSS